MNWAGAFVLPGSASLHIMVNFFMNQQTTADDDPAVVASCGICLVR